tara:strand:+ start:538 stop:786 length:249 start_codon:yes stop_codon:yes gene_type:complete
MRNIIEINGNHYSIHHEKTTCELTYNGEEIIKKLPKSQWHWTAAKISGDLDSPLLLVDHEDKLIFRKFETKNEMIEYIRRNK